MRTRRSSSFSDLDELAAVERRWTRQQVEVYQLTQLRRTIRIAETYCPFYKQRFVEYGVSYLDLHTAKDLAKFPTLTRQDVDEHGDELVINHSLGNANTPVGSWQSKTASGNPEEQKEKVFLDEILRSAGKQPQHRTVLLGDRLCPTTPRRWLFDIRRKSLHLSASDLSAETANSYVRRIDKFRPHFMIGYPSALLMLALHIDRENFDIHLGLETIICTAERLDSSQQRFLERTFKTTVVGRYVQPERIVVALQADNGLYHFSPGYGYAELDHPNESGAREILGTSFHNDVMPLVRYRTGDLVADRFEGHPFPGLSVPGFVGRTDEFLIDKSGKRIWPVHLSLDESPFEHVVCIQFFQDQPGVATLRFVASRGLSKHERKLIKRRLSVALGKRFKVNVHQTTWLPRRNDGRLPWVVNQIGA